MSDTTNIEKREASIEQPERTRSGRTYVPPVDIIEKPDELLLLADVPGANAENIDIDYERGELRITAPVASRQSDDTNYVWREYGIGDFVRTFQIGEGIDPAKIEATVSSGVLAVKLPKHKDAQTRRVAVRNA
jgi:HSP20 family protein